MWMESVIELDKNVGFLTLLQCIQIMNLVWKDSVLHILMFSCQSHIVRTNHTLTLHSPPKLLEGMVLFNNSDFTSIIALFVNNNNIPLQNNNNHPSCKYSLNNTFPGPKGWFLVHLPVVLGFLCRSSGLSNAEVCVLDFFS